MISTLNISPEYYSRAFEFAAFRGRSFPTHAHWPTGAGAAAVDSLGRPLILHIGATRWLLPDPRHSVMAHANEFAAEGVGMLFDCSGKYMRLDLSDRAYLPRLARSIDLEEILEGRGCGQTCIFDCPTIIARTETGLWAWIGSSHARSFLKALA